MIDEFLKAPIYKHQISDLIPTPTKYQCFPGAWYYKILTSKDKWIGIETIITLPEFVYDEERYDIIKKRYLDTPSVYLGGVSDFENDIGFGWFQGKVNGKITEEKITFRPFWRYIYLDENGLEKNIYAGTNIDQTEYYFFPKDKIKISLFSEKDNYLTFRIELLKETSHPKYKEIRNLLNKKPEILVQRDIPAPGVGVHLTEFKRCNAIDQYGNEGKPAQMTTAKAYGAMWESCYLYRRINEKIHKVLLTRNLYMEMKCPNEKSIEVKRNMTIEYVNIHPFYE